MDIKKINWEMIIGVGTIVSVVLSNYVFTENVRKDIKEDMRQFERRVEILDNRWVSLLEEIHSQDKKIWELEKKIEKEPVS